MENANKRFNRQKWMSFSLNINDCKPFSFQRGTFKEWEGHGEKDILIQKKGEQRGVENYNNPLAALPILQPVILFIFCVGWGVTAGP